MDHVNTFSQFDTEIAKAYKQDKFLIKRLEGLHDIRVSWDRWLGYRNYGTTKKSSSIAKAQGGRQEDVMCMHFFKNAAGIVLMQYKYMESDKYWLPYNVEGIPVFAKTAPTSLQAKLQHPPVKGPVPWPERPQVEKYLLEAAKISDDERAEWKTFFDSIPTSTEDIPEAKRFTWRLCELATEFKTARRAPQQVSLAPGLEPRPDHMFEKVIWDGFTPQQWAHDNAERARRHEAELHADNERQRSQLLQQHLSQAASCSSQQYDELDAAVDEPVDDSTSSYSQTTSSSRHKRTTPNQRGSKGVNYASSSNSVPVGDAGVVDLGDFVLFSPDEDSRRVDESNDYHLGINVGKVIKTYPKTGKVTLWWFWGTAWTVSAKWIEWRDKKTKKAYTDDVDVGSLLQTGDGMVAKLQFISKGHEKFSLTKDSVAIVDDVLKTNDF